MPFAALDLHRREIEAAIFDDDGRLTHRERLAASAPAIVAFAQAHLSPLHHLVVEATFNTWAIVELLKPFVASITVNNPLLTKAIASAKIKTDKIDVTVLAHLLVDSWRRWCKPAGRHCRSTAWCRSRVE